jgi:hypothetical protein
LNQKWLALIIEALETQDANLLDLKTSTDPFHRLGMG